MRILIYGGREFANPHGWTKGSSDWLQQVKKHQQGMDFLTKLSLDWPKFQVTNDGNWLPDVTVISGGAKGADALGEDWAVVNWVDIEVFKPNWNLFGKRAGMLRNQEMLDSGVDLAVQFPGGRGTADMRSRLDKAGVRVIEYKEPEDKVEIDQEFWT